MEVDINPKDYKCPYQYIEAINTQVNGVEVFIDKDNNIHLICDSDELVDKVNHLLDKHEKYWLNQN